VHTDFETSSASEAGNQSGRRLVRPVGVGDLAAVAVLQAAFLVPIGLIQPVNGDEGFYAMAAKLVAHGHMVYVDFWYQQAPLLPYVYGAWLRVFGQSWYSLRLLSCLLAIVLGTLLYRHVSIRSSSRWLGGIAVLSYASAPTVLTWFVLIKTYALSSLLLFVGYLFVGDCDCDRVDRDPARDRWRWAYAGLFAGLAADVRFVVAPAMLVRRFVNSRQGRHSAWACSIQPRVQLRTRQLRTPSPGMGP
jgi:Dolichyl-phosphate-mannose-protein mannosyltransferase